MPFVRCPKSLTLYLIYLPIWMIFSLRKLSSSSYYFFQWLSSISRPLLIISMSASCYPESDSCRIYSKYISECFSKSELFKKLMKIELSWSQNTCLRASSFIILKQSFFMMEILPKRPFLMASINLYLKIPSLNLCANPSSLMISQCIKRYATLDAESCLRHALMMDSKAFSSLIKNDEYMLDEVILYNTVNA